MPERRPLQKLSQDDIEKLEKIKKELAKTFEELRAKYRGKITQREGGVICNPRLSCLDRTNFHPECLFVNPNGEFCMASGEGNNLEKCIFYDELCEEIGC